MFSLIEVPIFTLFFGIIIILFFGVILFQINTKINKIFKENINLKVNQKITDRSSDEKKGLDEKSENGNFVISPMVGLLYLTPDPSKPQFVNIGDHIKQGDTVAIIEAMKTYSSVRATKTGIIKEFYVENGTPVGYGDKILKIE